MALLMLMLKMMLTTLTMMLTTLTMMLTTVTMMMWSMSVTTLELGKGDNKISDVPPRVTQLCFAELCFIRVFTQCSVENIYLTLSHIWVNGQWSLKTRFNLIKALVV